VTSGDASGREALRGTGVVGVVGGGIAGLCTALALHRQGIGVEVIESRTASGDGGFGINLPGNAIRALGELGVDRDELVAAGRPQTRREYRNAEDSSLFSIDEAAFWGEFEPVCLRRNRLTDLLRNRLPPGTVREGIAVTGVHSVGEHAVVELDDGTTRTYDYVVGADGINSVVRRSVGAVTDRRSSITSDAGWRFVAANPGVACWTVWLSTRGIFLLIPLDGDTVYGYASMSVGGQVGEDPSWLQRTFQDYPPVVGEAIRTALSGETRSLARRSTVEEIRLQSWSFDRIVLIGDAAHATAPIWAQGAAMAAEDALVLAGELAAHRSTPSEWHHVGPDYERRRRERVDHVKTMTDASSQAAGLPDEIRNQVLPEVGPQSFAAVYEPLRESALHMTSIPRT
jgi:2-polyprenyl-6-methoxyphenol hydroxylase-like FAD-dependent oxidoreductase